MARRRSPGKELLSLFQAERSPVYLLDAERRFVFGNRAFGDWLQLSPLELWGKRCDDCATSAELTAALAPPASLWERGTIVRPILFRGESGQVTRRRATFQALGSAPSAVLVTVCAEEMTADELASMADSAASESELLQTRLRAHFVELRARHHHDLLLGPSAAIQRVREQVRVAMESDVGLLIQGSVGSGREGLARAIHASRDHEVVSPLLPITCELMPAEVLQTTVLGFLRRCRELPASVLGTLLLLNADQLAWEAQLELRAFLSIPTFTPRIMATVEHRLLDLAAQERYDPELALALSTFEIVIPPLASRRKDIPFLAQQAVERWNQRGGKQLAGFTGEALDCLCALPWSGEFAELLELIQGACEQAIGPHISRGDLPRRVDLLTAAARFPMPHQEETLQLDRFLAEVERELLQRAVARSRGNKARAARLLGIPRARLLRRLEQLGLTSREE